MPHLHRKLYTTRSAPGRFPFYQDPRPSPGTHWTTRRPILCTDPAPKAHEGESPLKFLCHIAARAGSEQACSERIASLEAQWREQTAGEALAIKRLTRLANDVFGKKASYRETIDIRGDAATPERLARLTEGMRNNLEDVAHPDLSTTLIGKDVVFIEPDPQTTVRYQYLMRRNASYDHESYLKRYREIHSQFGLRLQGIRGYVQFHVDPVASRNLGRAAGLGAFGVDSVSELYLDSLESFLEGVSGSPVGAEAIADEELFVDRSNSVDFCSRHS